MCSPARKLTHSTLRRPPRAGLAQAKPQGATPTFRAQLWLHPRLQPAEPHCPALSLGPRPTSQSTRAWLGRSRLTSWGQHKREKPSKSKQTNDSLTVSNKALLCLRKCLLQSRRASHSTQAERCGSPQRLCGTCSPGTSTHILLQTWPRLAGAEASALQDTGAALLPWPGPHGVPAGAV